MNQAPSGPPRSSFIVRIDRDDTGGVSGVIERVRTGAKEAFHGVDQIGAVLARMVEAERSEAREALCPPPRDRVSSGRGISTVKRFERRRGKKTMSAVLAGFLVLLPSWNAVVLGQATDSGMVAAVLPS